MLCCQVIIKWNSHRGVSVVYQYLLIAWPFVGLLLSSAGIPLPDNHPSCVGKGLFLREELSPGELEKKRKITLKEISPLLSTSLLLPYQDSPKLWGSIVLG